MIALMQGGIELFALEPGPDPAQLFESYSDILGLI
jgi:hypothetical protein